MRKKTAHVQERFLNCLRIQIVPEHHEEQRINSVIKFCKDHDFDNVMLFINSEEYHVGHMTKEEAEPWLAAMKRAKEALIKEGITVSLNPWIEIGQLDRGRKLKEGQDFVTVCDFNGRKSDMVACPFDENWKNYFMDFYAHLIREIDPEVVWIEDDFRMHNHPPLEYGGCFCEHHMKAFNEVLGTNYSREEFTEKMFGKNPDDDVKKAYLEVNRKCMRDLATDIGVMVKNLGLGTKIGLMSSSHPSHSMEYRDWHGIHKGFAQDGPMINRLHLPMYQEDISIKRYYQLFNLWPFVCRGYLPEECHVLPEIENGSFMVYAKDSEVVRFQLESSLPLEIEGMTYDIFDFTGNGAVEAFEYGEEIGSITNYMTAVAESGYSYSKLSGITILLDEKNSYNRPIKDSFYDMYPDEFNFGVLLQGHGISARCSTEKEFKDEVIVLAAGSVYNLTDAQLEKMFRDNRVILDGKAAMLLIDRGLGYLIGASGYKRYAVEQDVQSYEEIEGDTLVYGVPGYRATAFCRTGEYIAIKYDEDLEVKSRVYDYEDNELGYGMVVMKGNMIVPYAATELWIGMLHPLRGKILCDYIDSLEKDFVRADYSNVYAYYSKSDENVLILVNPTNHRLSNTRFKLTGSKLKTLYEIERDGRRKEKPFVYDEEGFVVVEEEFLSLRTKTFVLELL